MDSSVPLDLDLIKHTVSFHGQQLQKIWDSERGDGDLAKSGGRDFDFSVYQKRQKHLSFQDRGKRLKIQHFIVKRAELLFDSSNLSTSKTSNQSRKLADGSNQDLYAELPPYDLFVPLEKGDRIRHFFECIQPGDLLICSITTKAQSGMMLKVLCTDSAPFRYVADLNIKAFCAASEMSPGGVVIDKKGHSRSVMLNEAIRVELLEIVPDSEKLMVSMLRSQSKNNSDGKGDKLPQLGVVYSEDFPSAYKMCQERNGESYSELLEKSLGFANPSNTELLFKQMGMDQDCSVSFFKTLKGRFPMDEYAQELRHVQASKWAFKSVADGIAHFKANKHSEAFQCLNRALSIDSRNVEGLVARGALYANSGSFQKAIEDFECALKLNPNHQNARKYMGETLVALGRQYEDENKFDEAMKSYESCLTLVPFHEEASNSICFLENKMRGTSSTKLNQDPQDVNPSATSTDGLLLGNLTGKVGPDMKAKLKQLLKADEEEKVRNKKKKDRKKKGKHKSRRSRHHSSSSSTSSTSSGSSSSSSSSSDSDSSGSSRSGSASPKRKHKKNKKQGTKDTARERSLSPLSKRMALMEGNREPEEQKSAGMNISSGKKDADYEQRVKLFFEKTRNDDSDIEEKIRRFVEETAKWKKERPKPEKDSKKKKKKEKKTPKDKGKKKKSKEDEKRHKRKSHKSGDLDSSGLADQLENIEDGGRRSMKDALAKHMSAIGKKHKLKGSDSSSDDDDYTPSKKSKKEKPDTSALIDPEMEDLESKLKNYYAKVDKDKAPTHSKSSKSEEKKSVAQDLVAYPSPIGKITKVSKLPTAISPPKTGYMMVVNDNTDKPDTDLFAESPSPPAKAKGVISPKWKMQINPASSKLKRVERKGREPWEDDDERVVSYSFDREEGEASSDGDADVARRRSGRNIKDSPAPATKTGAYYTRVLAKDDPSKMDPSHILPDAAPPSPVTGSSANRAGDDVANGGAKSGRKVSKSPASSRSSTSRKRRRRSRSGSYRPRSRSGSYRSRSPYSRSRSRSRSKNSRSRSRSFYSRSRSGSRDRYRRTSRSPDRFRRYDNRPFHKGPRGTYYKPRFPPFNNRQGYQRGRYQRRPFNHRGRNRGRPFFFNRQHGGFRDRDRDRFRRSRSRSYDRRSYEDRDRSTERERDRDRGRERDRHSRRDRDEEERRSDDDSSSRKKQTETVVEEENKVVEDAEPSDFIDRKLFGGKWADDDEKIPKGQNSRRSLEDIPTPLDIELPPENSIDEMDKFLNKVKAQKREEMKKKYN